MTTAVAVAGQGEIAHAAPKPAPLHRLNVQHEHVVPGTSANTATPARPDPAAAHALHAAPAAPVWPAAGVTIVDLTATTAAAAAATTGVPAGTTPVRVARHQPDHSEPSAYTQSAAALPASVRVEILDRASTDKLAGPGSVLIRLSRADGAATTATADVSIDTAGFAHAYGGDYTNRLHLTTLPDCTTGGSHEDPTCQPQPLPTRRSGTVLTATVPVAAATTSATTLAVTASADGKAGTFAATPLSPSGSWEAGGSSGNFSWSYPMRVPPALGGPVPQLNLAYSSQSVDGRHAASNNQPSWIGEGFESWSGYVERRYKSCADDMGTGANNTVKTGDLCWATDNATMSLNGKTVELVRDDTTGSWHQRSDDGSRVEHLTGASNGDNDGEYWKITTPSGTQYFFGRNRLPGWVSGKPETNSTWTVPVFGNNTGEPCHQATFDASWCNQAWRWNLDHVVDPHGNSMSFRYGTETNNYGRDLDSTKVSTYTRGGYLTEIDYGTRVDAEYGTAPARVLFTVADRCLPGTTCDSAHPANWPDVPWDQNCTGTTCQQTGPSFWTTKRLASVKTQVWGGSAYRDVEQWTLTHAFLDPGDGTRAGLWLSKISHVGLVGTTTTLPDVTFTGIQMHNRVDTIDGSPAMNWWRVASIRTDSGGEISVTYSPEDCVAGSRMPSAPESNTMRCYPVIWTPPGYTNPITDWFQKYVVTAVSQTDHTGGAPRVLTSYTYKGSPAWHYTDDDGLVPANQKTWSVWRGYGTVGTTQGDPGGQSYGEIEYFRGMDGDHLPTGTRSVQITDSRGGTFTDADEYSGTARERITYNGVGGPEVTSVLTDPWRSAPTATRNSNGVTTYARYINTGTTLRRVARDGGRPELVTKTVSTFDSYGAVTQTDDYGDVNDASDDQCTKNTYARNTGAWLMSYKSRVQTYALSCDKTPTAASQMISDIRSSYDGQAWGVAPTKGEVTTSEAFKDLAGGVPSYLTTARSAFDANGRVTDSWDVLNNHSTTAYTPPTGGPLTRTTATNPLGFVTVTDLEPAWGATLGVTDPNNRRTDVTYDGLGRTTAVWKPGRAKGVQSANTTYAYLVRTDGPLAVTTQTLGPNGTYITSYALYDSLGRPRQTQADAVGSAGGSLITDTLYDAAGRAYKTNAAYVTDTAPGTTLFTAAGDNQIPAQTLTLYDGANRTVASVLRSLGAEKWRTTTYYGGDHTDVTPPQGGVATSTVTDARGRTVALRSYHGGSPTGAYDTVAYTFTPQNLLATVTDNAGNTWTYGYDARGRQTSVTDPDKGTSTSTYDDAGRMVTTTDGRGHTLAYSYDALNRKTAEYDGSTSGTKLAGWTYDSLAKGQLTSSTRYAGGNAYVFSVTGYNAAYQATGTTVTVPASEGPLAGTYGVSTTYKPDGSVSTTTLPAAGALAQETLGYTYTDLGKLAALGGLASYVTQADYTRLGELSVLTMSTGGALVQSGRYYDEATRRLTRDLAVRETNPSTIADQNLTWNPAGDITAIADTPAGGTADVQCFRYDTLRRLTEAWTPGSGDCSTDPSATALGGPAPYWQSFSFDSVGDRTSKIDHAAGGDTTTTYAYPAAKAAQPHTLLSTTTTNASGSSTASYAYDPSGNTVSRPTGAGAQTLAWDAENRLASIRDATTNSDYVYDADGTRLIRHDASGATLFLPGLEVRATTSTQTVTATRYYMFGNQTVAQRTSSGVTWLMGDHQGTGEIAVDAATQAVTQRRQKPFGEPRGAGANWPNDRGFVDGTNEPGGLVHLGAREYDSGTGRFVSADPVFDSKDPQQMISYGYAGNSPVSASDPSGQRYMMEDGGGGSDAGSSLGGVVGSVGRGGDKPAPQPQPAPTYPPPVCSPATPEFCPGPKEFHQGYQLDWNLGSVKLLGSPEKIMKNFQQKPGEVFPFNLGGCTSIELNERCDLRTPAPWSSSWVQVTNKTSTSFTFTTLPGHFDPPGSTIQFTVYQKDGNAYLRQTGTWNAKNWQELAMAKATLPFAWLTWEDQAYKLRQQNNPTPPPDFTPADQNIT